MNFNKILAAFLVAGITAYLAGFISKALVNPEELEQHAFNIEIVEAAYAAPDVKEAAEEASGEAVEGAATEEAPSLKDMIADADMAKGKKKSKACAACHSFDKGGRNGVGPNLFGIVGSKKESVAGFKYSGKLNATGGDTWTYEELSAFLKKPKKYAPGTKMTYAGLKKDKDRANLIAWLEKQSD